MKKIDVIIVGAGPSGLRCAEILSKSDLQVLVLEKNPIFGDKVCAGGITRKGYQMLNFPDEIIEHKVDAVKLASAKIHNINKLPEPVMYTVDRKVFGEWLAHRLDGTSVEIRKNAKVTQINKNSVIIDDEEEIGFEYLVGADGIHSIVRKYLKLPVEKVLATVQYIIPVKDQPSCMEVHLNAKYFHSWYGWLFPHKDSVAVGACCHAKYMSGKELKANTIKWLEEQGFDLTEASYESFPISYDYRGIEFENIFLAGEAAGLASGLTGEGIYQSLVSGEEVANRILKNPPDSEAFKFILKYNNIQHKFLDFSLKAGPFRKYIGKLVILVMRNKWVNKKISHGFS